MKQLIRHAGLLVFLAIVGSACVVDGMDPAVRAQGEALVGAEPEAGLQSDGALTEQQAFSSWAPIYVEYGGRRADYERLFTVSSCSDASRAFDAAESRVVEVEAGDADAFDLAAATGLREAAGLIANRLGCDGFDEYRRWVP